MTISHSGQQSRDEVLRKILDELERLKQENEELRALVRRLKSDLGR
jgi:cell division protein FtsB